MMWYEQSYTARFTSLMRGVFTLFEETFEAFFQNDCTDFFAVVLVGLLCWLVAGLLQYMIRKSKT